MADVIWLACHSRDPLDRDRIERWATSAEQALPALLQGLKRDSVVLSHVALVVWADAAGEPQTWRQVECTPQGLAVNDGFPIGFEDLGLQAPAPGAIAGALAADPGRITRLQPPYASVSIIDGVLRLAVDALGFTKINRAVASGLTVWASRASLAALFTFGRAVASIEGWTTHLSHDRFMGDLTPLAGVVLEAGRTSVAAADAPDGLLVQRDDVIEALFNHHVDPRALAGIVEGVLARFHRSLISLGESRVRVNLSGGRDSRLIAATALRFGRVDEFWTSSPPELDVRIARQLVDGLDGSVPWTYVDKGEQTTGWSAQQTLAGTTTAALWEQLRWYQGWADGDGETTPWQRLSSGSGSGTVGLWGHGGEVARTVMYHPDNLSQASLRTETFWRAIRTGADFVSLEARQAVLAPQVDELRRMLAAHSVVDLHQLDYYHAFERTRRVKNRVGAIGLAAGLRPFYAFDYTRAGLGQTPEERLETRYYEEIIRRTVPRWADIPFSHQARKEAPTAATALSLARAFWASPSVELLGRDMLDALASDPLVVRTRIAGLVRRPAEHDPRLVQRMHTFNRLLNFVSYRSYLEALNRDFPAAGGAAALDLADRIPGITVEQVRRRRWPTRYAISLLAGRAWRAAERGLTRLAGRR